MERRRNTTVEGKPFNEETVEAVWAKANPDPWFTYFKRDTFGVTIQKDGYATQSKYGWEIDHILPVSLGGTDDLENLRPLHWANNMNKGDDFPNWEPGRRSSHARWAKDKV
jgi:5-methylcytosine-specific restriction endonuclease McrA